MSDSLLNQPWVTTSGGAQMIRSAMFTAVEESLDETFRKFGKRYAAHEHRFPPMIDASTLERFDYFTSFPGKAVFVAAGGGVQEREHVLNPAVCYHLYPLLESTEVSTPLVVTARGSCSRQEPEWSPHRLRSFTMREIIFLADPRKVESIRRNLMTRTARFASSMGLETELVEASDPFFAAGDRGKKALQQIRKFKYELRSDGIALASFNLHGNFFASRMNIRSASGSALESGCVAFGLERWVLAFLARHGMRMEDWPSPIARRVRRHDLR